MSEQKLKRHVWYHRYSEFIKAALIVLVISLALRVFLVFPFQVESTDMEGSFYEGDFLLVNQLSYKFGEPELGEIVVFEHPFKIGESTIGRIIALEGQTVEIIGKTVYVDNEALTEYSNVKYTDRDIIPEIYSARDYLQPVEVPTGMMFVLDDNRDLAEDSRNFGLVTLDAVKGKGMFVYWSWQPDSDSPRMESPYIIPAVKILFYNLLSQPVQCDNNYPIQSAENL